MDFQINQSFSIHQLGSIVPESESRKLDQRVLMQEMPYGYTSPPPGYDTGDHNMQKHESKKEYPLRKGKAY